MSEIAATNHPTHLQHHFSEMAQQNDSAKLGMWIFLLTEILTFGGLFVAYAVYRAWNPDMFLMAHKALDVQMGALNTVVLILSSVTMALGIRAIQLDNPKQSVRFLVITIGFAVMFLVVKYFEYAHKFHVGQLPGKFYTYTGIEGTNPHIFFSIYFMMTGLHALHILIGIGLLSWVIRKTRQNIFSSQYYAPVENVGLFWHLVDMIWIFLFPLFYLIG
ncbi:MAG TPA: cytochrome C oxidase subunit III [Candidatus Marinimicrobia bacterium]|nr:MAG: cytochrome C oxidase subunit III [Candidatus Marinimicrobia bacterium CG1_02_48_14]PIZ68714.1 MAG: cytochrome C oxidase subunit III [Candidatus Marinimicrobia bacterium CG_4_10_14_0_2_um_filter_48_9]PJA55083.1 MAG: cytochrome C oxidase subunit III [Candidatus Marinimicrobia bacterium CG_4_9_14_3_um_filter_48_9]HCW76408.1 cytochrome C oxidase subunit III [Candidatus Neomarinimicrobiota bacterium]